MRGDAPDPAFITDLEFLQNRDLDLSVRLGGMLAFNALMITIGTHPISASPGAPLSLDAKTQLPLVIASFIGIIPFILASILCLRALLLGEEFDAEEGQSEAALRQALFAAFVHSIDVQSRMLRAAVMATFAGGAMTLCIWAWIIMAKL